MMRFSVLEVKELVDAIDQNPCEPKAISGRDAVSQRMPSLC